MADVLERLNDGKRLEQPARCPTQAYDVSALRLLSFFFLLRAGIGRRRGLFLFSLFPFFGSPQSPKCGSPTPRADRRYLSRRVVRGVVAVAMQ